MFNINIKIEMTKFRHLNINLVLLSEDFDNIVVIYLT